MQKSWWQWHLPAIFPLWEAQTRVLSSARSVVLWAFFFSFPKHNTTNVMVLLPVEKWINKAHELFTKINSLTTQGQCSSQGTEPVKMFINNRTRLLIKLSQLVLPLPSFKPSFFFPGDFRPINIFHPAPASPRYSLQRCLLAQFHLIKATAKAGGYSELNLFKYFSAAGGENIDSMDTCKLWSGSVRSWNAQKILSGQRNSDPGSAVKEFLNGSIQLSILTSLPISHWNSQLTSILTPSLLLLLKNVNL